MMMMMFISSSSSRHNCFDHDYDNHHFDHNDDHHHQHDADDHEIVMLPAWPHLMMMAFIIIVSPIIIIILVILFIMMMMTMTQGGCQEIKVTSFPDTTDSHTSDLHYWLTHNHHHQDYPYYDHNHCYPHNFHSFHIWDIHTMMKLINQVNQIWNKKLKLSTIISNWSWSILIIICVKGLTT